MKNTLGRPKSPQDALYCADKPSDFKGTLTGIIPRTKRLLLQSVKAEDSAVHSGTYLSEPVTTRFPFRELLPSWNLALDEKRHGYRIRLRVCDEAGEWSPWFYLGRGGIAHEYLNRDGELVVEGWGKVSVDYLNLEKSAVQFQYEISLVSLHVSAGEEPAILRFFMAYTNPDMETDNQTPFPPVSRLPSRCHIVVPYRNQKIVGIPKLRNMICCPTCVAMLLEHSGSSLDTVAVARSAYDPEYKIYGAWPRASQTAAAHGLTAWIQRVRSHQALKNLLAKGQPVMASIRVKLGELPKASYKKSAGHLILIVGYDQDGNYLVNDPASVGPAGAEISYSASEIETVWFDKGGVAIIIRGNGSKSEKNFTCMI